MTRNNDVNSINLKIENIEIYPPLTTSDNEFIHDGCMRLFWASDIGWGQYDLFKDCQGKWVGESEYMDNHEDKDFIKKLMELFVETLVIC